MDVASLLRVSVVVGLFLGIIGAPARGDPPTPASLERAARRAYGLLKQKNVDALLPMLSKRGFSMALRKAVWPLLDAEAGKKTDPADFIHQYDEVARYGWEERELEYDLTNPTDIARLRKAIVRFDKDIPNTYGELRVALQQKDQWGERKLGPSAEGKMASNYYWYLYFRKEGGVWKIWRMELVDH
ncbi:MAG TPA: hypothetical protein VGM54_00740 [Chthoniobacter sp.]|jgi:hypothetical protein